MLNYILKLQHNLKREVLRRYNFSLKLYNVEMRGKFSPFYTLTLFIGINYILNDQNIWFHG